MNLRNTCPDNIRTKKEIYILHKEGSLLGWLRFFCIVALLLLPYITVMQSILTQAYMLEAVHKHFTI